MKKREEKPENNERWLLTYSDLITLLMIFFVVLYASSNVDTKKYKQVSNSFQSVFEGGGKGVLGTGTGKSEEGKPTPLVEEEKLSNIKDEFDSNIKEAGLEGNVNTSIEEKGIVISFNDKVFFKSGSSNLAGDAKSEMEKISKILKKTPNYIRIEGHTDNLPIKNNEFKSNWQLSAVRAANVAEVLCKDYNLEAKRISSVGYGENRPIDDNNTDKGRSKNRRVDIVILNNKFNDTEYNKSE